MPISHSKVCLLKKEKKINFIIQPEPRRWKCSVPISHSKICLLKKEKKNNQFYNPTGAEEEHGDGQVSGVTCAVYVWTVSERWMGLGLLVQPLRDPGSKPSNVPLPTEPQPTESQIVIGWHRRGANAKPRGGRKIDFIHAVHPN